MQSHFFLYHDKYSLVELLPKLLLYDVILGFYFGTTPCKAPIRVEIIRIPSLFKLLCIEYPAVSYLGGYGEVPERSELNAYGRLMPEAVSHVAPDFVGKKKAVISIYLIVERGGVLELKFLVPFP